MKFLTLPAAVAACALLVAACGPAVRHQSGDAAPAGAPASSAAAPPAASGDAITTPASSPASRASSPGPGKTAKPVVLGPTGLGQLQLGMTRVQANATGLVTFKEPTDAGCELSHLSAAPKAEAYANLSRTLGVAAIDAYDSSVKTPEGVHIGMPIAEVRRIYPSLDVTVLNDLGHTGVPVPGNSQAVFRIGRDADNKVKELTLQYRNQNCYE
jgi:hypothetical protein